MIGPILDELEREWSPSRAMADLQELYQRDRLFTFTGFARSAAYCRRALGGKGLAPGELVRYPADGATAYGDWVMPRAWDASFARLCILLPGGGRVEVASYPESPCSLHNYSAPTKRDGVVSDVVQVGDGSQARDFDGVDVRGKIVFTSQSAKRVYKQAIQHGAAGVLSDYVPESAGVADRGRLYDCVAWQRCGPVPARFLEGSSSGPGPGVSPGPGLSSGPGPGLSPVFGFSVSPRAGDWIRSQLRDAGRRGEALKAWALVRSRLYDGAVPLVTAVIPGTDGHGSGEEVMAMAHLFEPGALDNASGAAALIEGARAIRGLQERGRLALCRRSIRFVFSMECYGYAAYLAERSPEERGRIVGGINVDDVAVRHDLARAPLRAHRNPDSQARGWFTDALLGQILRELGRRYPSFSWAEDRFGGSDQVVADPMVGVPAPYLGRGASPFWHTSSDTPDKVDPGLLRLDGIAAAAYCYFLAAAGGREALWLLHDVGQWCRSRLLSESAAALNLLGRASDDLAAVRYALERLPYLGHRACEAVRGVARLCPEDPELQGSVERWAQEIATEAAREHARLLEAAGKLGLALLDAREDAGYVAFREWASEVVPVRKAFGSLTLDTLPREAEAENRWWPTYGEDENIPLFWCDGRRTLLEVALLTEQELGPGRVDFKDLSDWFRFLARHGYVELTPRVDARA